MKHALEMPDGRFPRPKCHIQKKVIKDGNFLVSDNQSSLFKKMPLQGLFPVSGISQRDRILLASYPVSEQLFLL